MDRVLLILFALFAFSSAEIKCRDMNNQPVDWFIFYKLPKDANITADSGKHGRMFLYLDARQKYAWTTPDNNDLASKSQSVAFTLQQFYDNKGNKQIFTMLYNDQAPSPVNKKATSQAKGALVFDGTSGFWMTHSLPQFPDVSTYAYSENTENGFGHMGLCVSFNYGTLKDISKQLFLINPVQYHMLVPAKFSNDFPELQKISQGLSQTTPPFTTTKFLKSAGGASVVSAAKSALSSEDIYAEHLNDNLAIDLDVQAARDYQTPSNNLHSNCSGTYYAYDISITYNSVEYLSNNELDHSKWAVAISRNPGNPLSLPYSCVGDLDRQVKDRQLGGGVLCLYDYPLWEVFHGTARNTFACGK